MFLPLLAEDTLVVESLGLLLFIVGVEGVAFGVTVTEDFAITFGAEDGAAAAQPHHVAHAQRGACEGVGKICFQKMLKLCGRYKLCRNMRYTGFYV